MQRRGLRHQECNPEARPETPASRLAHQGKMGRTCRTCASKLPKHLLALRRPGATLTLGATAPHALAQPRAAVVVQSANAGRARAAAARHSLAGFEPKSRETRGPR